MPALAGDDGTVHAGACQGCLKLSSGGVDWGRPSTAPATGSALEGSLSPAKGPVID